jgi:hypothetical protein
LGWLFPARGGQAVSSFLFKVVLIKKFFNNYPPSPKSFGGQVGFGFSLLHSCFGQPACAKPDYAKRFVQVVRFGIGRQLNRKYVICLENNLDVVVIWSYI